MRLPPHFGRYLVIALCLVSAGFFAAYLRFLPYLAQEATYTDGRRAIELSEVERLRFAVWDEPLSLPATVNSSAIEGRATLSPDGRLLVFAVGEEGLNADLWVAPMVDGEPLDPRPLPAVNTPFEELSPAFSEDWLYFASNRPGGAGRLDIYRVEYDDGVFGAVEWLGRSVNTEADESEPAPTPDASALAFSSDRPRGRRTDYDLYLALDNRRDLAQSSPLQDDRRRSGDDALDDGATPDDDASVDDASTDDAADDADRRLRWQLQPEPFVAVNTPFDERDPAFAVDGLALVFASDRDGSLGGLDLWRSVQSAGNWLEPEPLSGLNTEWTERAPMPSPDGFSLLFSAETPGDGGDLFRARSVELFRLPGRPVGWFDLTILALLLLVALLAWLGKRWEALDILYKCLLVSLLIHLGMMLWFREVEMEHENVDLPEGSPTFTVRLAPTRADVARSRERAGQLELAQREAEAAASPSRHESDAPPAEAAAPSAADALPTPQLAAADAPGRSESDHAQQREQASAEVALQDRAEATPMHTASAPAMTVAARESTAEARTPTPATTPQRSTTSMPQAAAGAAAPSRVVVAMPRLDTASPTATGRRTRVDPTGMRPAVDRDIALAEPPVQGASDAAASATSGEAPAMELSSLAFAAPAPDAGQRGPARPERASTSGSAGATTSPANVGPASSPLATSASSQPTRWAPAPSATSAGDAVQRPSTSSRPAIALNDAPSTSTEGTSSAPDAASEASSPVASETLGALSLSPNAQATSSRASRGPARPGRFDRASEGDATAAAAPTFSPLSVASATPTAGLPDARSSEWEHTPYRTRFGEAKAQAIEEHGGSVETERAVAAGLEYLARIQRPDGYWGSTDDYDDKYGHVSVGKTALCLLAFLGAGHTPLSGTKHSAVTERAVDFLLDVQDAPTGHFGYSSSYSHGIATYALAECYALTREPRLRRPIERAVSWILEHQNSSRDPRRAGGWGYYYPDGRTYDPWPRSSVTAWQIMALESARLGGLDVPDRAFDAAKTFLVNAHRPEDGVILYSQDPTRLRSAYWTLPGSTPAGLFALSLMDEDVTSAEYRELIGFIRQRAPSGFRPPTTDDFVARAAGNLYFWYYGSLVLFRHGGRPWSEWNRRLQNTLLPSQNRDGSWEPISLYADYAGDDAGDRSYTTAMCVLTLEVYYRYFTPLLNVK